MNGKYLKFININKSLPLDNENIFNDFKFLLESFFVGLPRFIKYQIITKILLVGIIIPFFSTLIYFLINLKDIKFINHSIIPELVKSPHMIILLILVIALLLIGILLEIFGFIIISTQIISKQLESSYVDLLKESIKKIPIMLEFGSFILFIYLVLFIPLTKIGVPLSFLQGIKIPYFIFNEIENNLYYLITYIIFLILMIMLSIRWIFTFHFIVIGNLKPSKAMKASSTLLKNNYRLFLKKFIGISVITSMVVSAAILLWISIIVLISMHLNLQHTFGKSFMILLLMLQQISLSIGIMLYIPFEIHHFTLLFYKFVKNDSIYSNLGSQFPIVAPKQKKSVIDLILDKKKFLVILSFIVLILLAIPIGTFFEDFFQNTNQIQIMAHRGGTANGPENTIYAINKSIKNGAHWVEIDVQRTKDGVYVLNHDDTFARVAGENRKVTEMNYIEIKKLKVGIYNSDGAKGIPTLEEVLDICNNKIGINIELKGTSADEKMVDDIVKMVNNRNMKSQIIMTSFDYNLVKIMNNKYPQFNIGFIDFMAFGDIGSLKANYIIVEETVANSQTIDKIHDADKKALVWTVNSPESMKRFAKSEIDIIITDDVINMKTTLKESANETTQDLLLEQFFSKLDI